LLEKHMTSVRLARALVAATLAGLSGLAVAQTWPAKPIRFIMTAGPGSSIDVIGRVLGERIQGPLGQPVVIDNRVGAGGTIATDAAAKAAPDGYTMVLSFNGPLSFGPHMYTKLPYDPFKDLAAVVLTTSQPNLLAVNAGLPVKSVRELIDYVRRNPGKLNYGSIGSGSSSHLTMELMKMQAGLFIVHIPYNGSPPAAASLAAADTQVLFTVPTALTPLIQAGKVRALAVSGLKRYSLMPEVPTVAESGLAKFEAIAWNGVLVPAGTPRPIIDRLNREMNLALESADVRQKLNAAGLEPVGGTPEEFTRLIRAESDKWAPVIQRTGAKVD
jgi:tripartite-type tricarboxylate transporter receptor subunit TctC